MQYSTGCPIPRCIHGFVHMRIVICGGNPPLGNDNGDMGCNPPPEALVMFCRYTEKVHPVHQQSALPSPQVPRPGVPRPVSRSPGPDPSSLSLGPFPRPFWVQVPGSGSSVGPGSGSPGPGLGSRIPGPESKYSICYLMSTSNPNIHFRIRCSYIHPCINRNGICPLPSNFRISWQIAPTPRGSILYPLGAAQVPYNAKHKQT